jgi:hypothetical protein
MQHDPLTHGGFHSVDEVGGQHLEVLHDSRCAPGQGISSDHDVRLFAGAKPLERRAVVARVRKKNGAHSRLAGAAHGQRGGRTADRADEEVDVYVHPATQRDITEPSAASGRAQVHIASLNTSM